MSSLRDNGILVGIVALLWLALWARARIKANPQERVTPYREPLVPEDFFTVCRGAVPLAAAERPAFVWIARGLDAHMPDAALARHELCKWAAEVLGWSVTVVVPRVEPPAVQRQQQHPYRVFQFYQKTEVEAALARANWIVASEGVLETAAVTAARCKLPLRIVANSEHVNDEWRRCTHLQVPTTLVVDSRWLLEHYAPLGLTTFVMPPPFNPKGAQTHTTRRYITWISDGCPVEQELFVALVRACPDLEFLAVTAAQPQLPRNCIVWPAQPNRRFIWNETRVFLHLSKERAAYPRAALEAACSGIPTIAHPTPVIREVFGDSTIPLLDREHRAAWVDCLRRYAAQPFTYEKACRAVSQLAHTRVLSEDLERLRSFWETAVPRA